MQTTKSQQAGERTQEQPVPHPAIINALLKAGVSNLREFGYPDVDEYNIITNLVFSRFFDRMLEEHKGQEMEVAWLRSEIKQKAETF